jgi:hypothetical protein
MRRMDMEALRKQIAEQVQTDFETQMRELRRMKNNAEEELDSAGERWRLERRKLKADIAQLEEKLFAVKTDKANGAGNMPREWEQERERLKAQILSLEASLATNIAQTEQIRRDYEARTGDLVQRNEILKRELDGMAGGRHSDKNAAIVDAIEVHLQPADSSIDAEMKRVEEAIRGIETLLEHPNTTASMMARKNIERAENEAYLRGLNFRLSRAKSA